MKAVKISKFRPNLMAIAGMEWGGDCTSYKTNRKGVGYYSCAGHGGYVVDGNALKNVEKRSIEKCATPTMLNILIQHRNDGDYVVGVSAGNFSYSGRSKRIKINPYEGKVEWKEHPIYLFEEDEMWGVLEHLTDITNDGWVGSKEEHERIAKANFNRICGGRNNE